MIEEVTMLLWHKSSADSAWQTRYRNSVADVFKQVVGVELGVGAQYDHAGQRMEIHSHPAITAKHIDILAADPNLDGLLVGGGDAVPATWTVVKML